MAILKRVKNGTGDGAGRARYALRKAIMVWTDIPSSLSLLPAESLLRKREELANEFNRHLKRHQGSYKTQHFVLSFGHYLSEEEILEVIERLRENIFYDSTRLHLIAVHQERHGTAFHIIESGNQEGRLRHLSRKEFYFMNRKVKLVMRPFMNEREREVERNFINRVATQDWRHQIEIKAPERSFKVKVRKILIEEVAPLVKQGKIKEAKKVLKKNGIEVKEYKAGEISPKNKKVLKRDRLYAFVNWNDKQVAITLDSKMKATYLELKKAIEECENGLERIGKEARQDRERTEKLRDEVKAHKRADTELRRKIDEIERANRELRAGIRRVAEGSEELEREALKLGERVRRTIKQAQNFDGRESATSELEQAIRVANSLVAEDGEAQRRDFERVREQISELYKWTEREFGITREELEKKDYRSRDEFENDHSRHKTNTGESKRSREEIGNFEGRPGKEAIDRDRERRKEGEIYSSSDFGRSLGRDGRSFYRIRGETGILERSEKQSGKSEGRTPGGDSKENNSYLDRAWNTGSSPSPKPVPEVRESEKEEEIRIWILDGEEITEEEIKGNPAVYVDCEIKEVKKLAWKYLLEEIDEEYEFLKAEGYFRDIEELEMLDEVEEKRERKQKRERDSGIGLDL